MGFRNPITSAAAVDTGQPSTAGMRIYQGSDATGVYGVLEARDGIVGDNPMQLVARANLVPQGGGYTQQGGGVALKGGSYNGTSAPEIDLNVEGLPAGGFGPVARINATFEPLIPATALPLNGAFFGPFDPTAPTYRKTVDGLVIVSGRVVVNSTSFGSGATIGTLPAGCRPAANSTNQPLSFGLLGWNSALWRCDLFPDGRITWAGNGPGATSAVGSFLSLDGIRFAAGQ